MGIAFYTCSICGSSFAPQEVQYTCPRDGGNLDVHCDFETAEKNHIQMWCCKAMNNLSGAMHPCYLFLTLVLSIHHCIRSARPLFINQRN